MNVVINLVIMVLKVLWERDQNTTDLKSKEAANLNKSILWIILSCLTKDMLFWERGSVFVLIGKKKILWKLSKVIWIRYGKRSPHDDLGSR